LVFWIFCSSRQTAVTVTSALSLLIGASVGEFSAGDPVKHAALSAAVALMVGVIACAGWLFRAGNAVAFFSETVLVGFKCGLAFYLASTQLPKLFGFKGTHGDFWERSAYFLRHLGETQSASLLIGGLALACLIAGKLWLKNRPVSFVVVVLGILAAPLLDLEARGVALLGDIPQGLPALGLPDVTREEVNALVPLALACFVLGAVETSAIGRMFAARHGYRLDANQELLAIGASNLLVGLGRGFPVSGGMSQSLVNEGAGARTPLSGFVAAVFTLVIVLFASGLLRNLPQPVLAGIVLAAVMGLIDVKTLRHIWHFSRTEFFIALAAFLGVLGSSPVNGALLGAAISIVLLLRQAASPRVVELGRVAGSTYFADRLRQADTQRIPGVLVVRCESSLLYFNVEHVRARMLHLVAEREDPVKLVVLFMGAVPRIDLAGAELLADLKRTCRAKGIAFRLSDAHGEVREALKRSGFLKDYGALDSAESVDAIVTAWQSSPTP
jgi:high affinity sulfate transporter 1